MTASENFLAACAYASANPALLSMLYDIGLMPEQVREPRAIVKFMAVVTHWRNAKDVDSSYAERNLALLVRFRSLAAEAAEHLDADRDVRCLKLLMAMCGSNRGYRADIDEIHAALAKNPGDANNSPTALLSGGPEFRGESPRAPLTEELQLRAREAVDAMARLLATRPGMREREDLKGDLQMEEQAAFVALEDARYGLVELLELPQVVLAGIQPQMSGIKMTGSVDPVADFLHGVGWKSPNDAQWSRLRDALPDLRDIVNKQFEIGRLP